MIPAWRTVWYAGFALIMVGIACLFVSDQDVHGWWQGTLQAFGVGFIVGGVVDVLVISSLNQTLQAERQRQQKASSRAAALVTAFSENYNAEWLDRCKQLSSPIRDREAKQMTTKLNEIEQFHNEHYRDLDAEAARNLNHIWSKGQEMIHALNQPSPPAKL